MSISQLCDDGCLALLSNTQRPRSSNHNWDKNFRGMWEIPLSDPQILSHMNPLTKLIANGVLRCQRTKQELVQCHVGYLFNARTSTII